MWKSYGFPQGKRRFAIIRPENILLKIVNKCIHNQFWHGLRNRGKSETEGKNQRKKLEFRGESMPVEDLDFQKPKKFCGKQPKIFWYHFLRPGNTESTIFKTEATMQGKVEICGVNTARLKTLTSAQMDLLLLQAKQGDETARKKLIEGNLRLVLSVIQRLSLIHI